jgi:hypothetical protein
MKILDFSKFFIIQNFFLDDYNNENQYTNIPELFI